MFAQDRDGQFGTGIRSERPLVACNTDSLLLPHWELLRGVLGGGAVEMHQGFTAELKHGHAALKPLAQALCHWPLAQGLKPDSSSNLMTWQLAFLVNLCGQFMLICWPLPLGSTLEREVRPVQGQPIRVEPTVAGHTCG